LTVEPKTKWSFSTNKNTSGKCIIIELSQKLVSISNVNKDILILYTFLKQPRRGDRMCSRCYVIFWTTKLSLESEDIWYHHSVRNIYLLEKCNSIPIDIKDYNSTCDTYQLSVNSINEWLKQWVVVKEENENLHNTYSTM